MYGVVQSINTDASALPDEQGSRVGPVDQTEAGGVGICVLNGR